MYLMTYYCLAISNRLFLSIIHFFVGSCGCNLQAAFITCYKSTFRVTKLLEYKVVSLTSHNTLMIHYRLLVRCVSLCHISLSLENLQF